MVRYVTISVPLQALYLLHAFKVQVSLTNMSFDFASKVSDVVLNWHSHQMHQAHGVVELGTCHHGFRSAGML